MVKEIEKWENEEGVEFLKEMALITDL